MVSAVGSSSQVSNTSPSTGPSRSGLEAQVARYQKQLADCVACPSSKTPEGQANIQSLSNKLGAAQANLKDISDKLPTSPSTIQNSASDTKDTTNISTQNSTSPSNAGNSSVGNLVNIYA